jgi:hypothetical protein
MDKIGKSTMGWFYGFIINTHFKQNLHLPSTNLTLVQKGVLFSGSKIFNHLPQNIKLLCDDPKRFKYAL